MLLCPLGELLQRRTETGDNKGKEEGQLRLALFPCGEPPCRKVSSTHHSSLQQSGTPRPTRPHSETPTFTSSSRVGSGVCLPRASINDSPTAFPILRTTISNGFYQTWFTCDKDRLEFLRWASRHPCYDDPKFTFSDVERAIKQQIRSRNYVALYELKTAEELRSAEMAILVRLESKYRSPVATVTIADSEMNAGDENRPLPPAPAPCCDWTTTVLTLLVNRGETKP